MARSGAVDRTSRVTGWWVFAAILLGIAGVLNIIYGIAAIGDSKFFTENATYILSDLNTWGWVTLLIGVVQLFASFSLISGGGFGRVIGIVAASLSAVAVHLRPRHHRDLPARLGTREGMTRRPRRRS